MDWLRDTAAPPFEQKGRDIFKDPWAARNSYIDVILNRRPENADAFFARHATHELGRDEKILGLKLMEMQRHAMLMYTSCGWFFDELSGIETTQVIQYAGRTLQLYQEIFSESIDPMFLDRLAAAKSNIPEHKDGRTIYDKFVKPAMVDRQKVAAHYALSSLFEPYPEEAKVYCYKVELEDSQTSESGRSKLVVGRVRITSEITQESGVYSAEAGVKRSLRPRGFRRSDPHPRPAFRRLHILVEIDLPRRPAEDPQQHSEDDAGGSRNRVPPALRNPCAHDAFYDGPANPAAPGLPGRRRIRPEQRPPGGI